MNKICSFCKRTKNTDEFHKDKNNRYGIVSQCKPCRSLNKKKSSSKHKSKIDEYNRSYHLKNQKSILSRKKADYWLNKGKHQIITKLWSSNNRGTIAALAAKKRASKKNATPKWLTKDHLEQIKEIYKKCPSGHHVDHIIPLAAIDSCGNRIASGLHVPWNLQYLHKTENIKKKNRI